MESPECTRWTIEAIAACSTAGILLLTALITLIIAIWQLTTAKKARNAQLVVGLFDKLRSEATLETLKLIYRTSPDKIKELQGKEIGQIEQVLDWLDMIGHLLKRGIIDEYLAVEAFAGPPILKCWHQLQQFIEETRQQRGGRYCNGVQYFAKCAVKFQIKHAPRVQWITFYREPSLKEPKINKINLIDKELTDRNLLSKRDLLIAKSKRNLRSLWQPTLRGEKTSKFFKILSISHRKTDSKKELK